jgi:glycerol kinase
MSADSGLPIDTLRVDGGMAANDWAMQFLADILPARVERPASIETTAWGAAYVAGLQRGVCSAPDEMVAHWRAERVFAPAMPGGEREERYAGWQRAVTATLAVSGT